MTIRKKCVICGNTKYLKNNYGAHQSCSVCGTFFRRTVLKNNGKIPEPCTVKNCSGCTSCRIKKCKDKGMHESYINMRVNERRACAVCGGKEFVKFNFGVQCCVACKNFFHKTILKLNGKLPEPCTDNNCKGCTSCWMKKCKAKGMDENYASKEKKCVICGCIKPVRFAYGVVSCTGCATFFRTTVLKNNGKIPEPCTVKNCSGCESCRMKKCKDKGMDEMLVNVRINNRKRIMEEIYSDVEKRKKTEVRSYEKNSSLFKNKTGKKKLLYHSKRTGNFQITSKTHEGQAEKQAGSANVMPKTRAIMAYSETVILRPKLSKTKQLLKMFGNDVDKSLTEVEMLLNLKQNKSNAKITAETKREMNKVITNEGKKIDDFENIIMELQNQAHLKHSRIFPLQQKIDKVSEVIEKIDENVTYGKSIRFTLISELKKKLQETRIIIEELYTETAANQIQFSESLDLIVESPDA